MSARPLVLLVGDTAQPEFAAAVALMHRDSCLRCVASLDDAAQLVESREFSPEVIVLAQVRPGEFCGRVVGRIQSAAPDVEIRALLGTWCEGETRTGTPWPDIDRLYWYEFPGWWQRFEQRWTATQRKSAACVVSSVHGDHRGPSPCGLVVVATQSRDSFQAIADAMTQAGFASVWRPPPGSTSLLVNPLAGVWEGGQLTDVEVPRFKAFRSSLGAYVRHCVALLDFPRHDRVQLAHQIGATAVLGKPWRLDDLCQALGVEPNSRPTHARVAGQGQAA